MAAIARIADDDKLCIIFRVARMFLDPLANAIELNELPASTRKTVSVSLSGICTTTFSDTLIPPGSRLGNLSPYSR